MSGNQPTGRAGFKFRCFSEILDTDYMIVRERF